MTRISPSHWLVAAALALAAGRAPADEPAKVIVHPPESMRRFAPEKAEPSEKGEKPEKTEKPEKSEKTTSSTESSHGGLDAVLPASDERIKLESYWDKGYHLESSDKNFRLHIGGTGQIDSTWLIGPTGAFAVAGGAPSGIGNSSATFLRRARLRAEGDIYGQFDYSVEYDFANANNENSGLQPPSFSNLTSAPTPKNVWVQVREVPGLGDVRFGNLVKPIGLTKNTSHRFLPFMERADNMDAFYGPFDNGYSVGLAALNRSESELTTWQFGIYRPQTNAFGVGLNKFAWGGRVTGLPVYEDDGERLVHLGFGTFCGELPEDQLRVRARPELRNGPGFAVPVLVDTGNIPGSRQYTLAPEFAAVAGPWTVQAEYACQFLTDATVNGVGAGNLFYHGGYIQVLYFLTGEHQSYDKRDGAFGRVMPKANYRVKKCEDCRSLGAWQIGARFSYLDLNDASVQAGRLYDGTFGLNWFFNPNVKVQFNYIVERRDVPTLTQSWINGVGVRAAFDF